MPSSRGSPRPRDQTCISYPSCIGRHVLHHLSHQGSPWSVHPLPIPVLMAHTSLPSGHHGALGVGGKASGTKSGRSKCGDLECTRQSRGWRSGTGRDPSCLLLRKNPERERSERPRGEEDSRTAGARRASAETEKGPEREWHCLLSHSVTAGRRREPGLLTLNPQADFNLMERVFWFKIFYADHFFLSLYRIGYNSAFVVYVLIFRSGGIWDLSSLRGVKPAPPALESEVLATGPRGKSLERVLYVQNAHPQVQAMPSMCRSLDVFAHTTAHTMVSARGSLSVYVFMMFVGVSLSVHVGLGHTHGCVWRAGPRSPPEGWGAAASAAPPAGVPVPRAPPRAAPQELAGPGQTLGPKLFRSAASCQRTLPEEAKLLV